MKRLVSVVITTHNHVAYIRGCINSVLEQTYKNLEIIVVDDGSTDETKQVLEKYIRGGKIRYFYQSNSGMSAARNTGLKLAEGSYIKFLDSDDWLYPLQIEKQMDDLVAANDEQAMSMTNFSMMGPSGKIVEIDVPMVKKEQQLGHFIESNRGAPHSFLFPIKMVRDIGGFDGSTDSCSDLDIKIQLILRGAYVRKADCIGCCYRIVDTSMSSDTFRMFVDKCKVYEKVNHDLWGNRKEFDWFLKEKILMKNALLIDECIARRLALEQVLPKTVRMASFMYQTEKAGITKVIYQCLGIKRYSWLRFHVHDSVDWGYRNRLLTQDTSWKIS
ncbi:MAG: glycosyltransferase family 2 protein [Candidatus Omnitrophica bacterium]|nr:glycosyltransferase family 2 protein [Candidatus Omnitrophota bacterium]